MIFEENGFGQIEAYLSIFLSNIAFKKDNYYMIPANNTEIKLRKPKNVNELLKIASFECKI
jgi:hypothetical protein